MEELTVIIPTYNRPRILARTIALLHINLKYDGRIHYLIGNDGDGIEHSKFMFEVSDQISKSRSLHTSYLWRERVIIAPSPHRGLGANLNFLLKMSQSRIVLQMDDDHHLVKPLDINQYVKDVSTSHNGVGWVRLFLGTEEDLTNDDPFYKFEAEMLDRYWYPTPGTSELYIASNRPHIKGVDFHSRWYGFYPDDTRLGETETAFCHQYVDRHAELNGASSRPWVVIPVAAPPFDAWQHVGDSWQKEGL